MPRPIPTRLPNGWGQSVWGSLPPKVYGSTHEQMTAMVAKSDTMLASTASLYAAPSSQTAFKYVTSKHLPAILLAVELLLVSENGVVLS
jgi:hypothetical protein